jgi:hypothetical protein
LTSTSNGHRLGPEWIALLVFAKCEGAAGEG